MVRLLIWVALIAAGVWFWRKYKRPASTQQKTGEQGAAPMVRCAHCGVHSAADRALSQRQDWYCTQAHLEQGSGQTLSNGVAACQRKAARQPPLSLRVALQGRTAPDQ
jgi:uncharacterized protein